MSRERSKFPSTKSIRRFYDRLIDRCDKIEPTCRHFGECGGCYFQNIPYESQLQVKSVFLKELFGDRFDLENAVVPSPSPFRYRHRMDYVAAFGKMGLRRRGNYREVIDLEECHLISVRAFELMNFVRERIRDYGIKDYDFIENEGFFRYLVLREGKFTDQLMAIFITAAVPDLSQKEKLIRLMEECAEKVDSVHWIINETLSDHSSGDPIRYFGRPTITEIINGHRFIIKPDIFFQSNPLLIGRAYDDIKSNVCGKVLDLYCGTGTISIHISDACRSVKGVELVASSVETARENLKLNGVENVEFRAENVGEYVKKAEKFDVIVVDPPRAGLTRKIIGRLRRMAPERIVYMSCNPVSQYDDLKRLSDDYVLEKPIRAYDMFPQTYHVETLAVLRRRSSRREGA